jgi:putative Mg2+ transporter-C (MgtC) family protein
MDLEPLWRVLWAALLAIPIGLDRELRGKAAGLRTHVLVSTAAAAFGYVSLLAAPSSASGADGTRIAAQVVTGIGFMGAGVIFAAGGRVYGLTTAAALFSASAVGLCVGLGELPLAAALAFVTLLFLWPIDRVADRALTGLAREERELRIVAPDFAALARVQRLLAEEEVEARQVTLEPFGELVSARLTIRVRRKASQPLLERLATLDDVSFVTDEGFAPTD